MRKIIVAFDGLKYSIPAQEHAIALAKQSGAFLVGVFLNDLFYHSYRIYDLIAENGGGMDARRKHLDKKDEKTRARAVETFEKACKSAGVKYSTRKDKKAAVRELINESIYADLLVVDSTESFSNHKEAKPTHFIRQILPNIQCPVIVVSEQYKPIEKIVLLFDGTPLSMHAIRMMCFTFPFLTELPTEVLTINPGKKKKQPVSPLAKEFMSRHFQDVYFLQQEGLPELVIPDYLAKKTKNTLVVLGAYQRSAVSRWFRESMADVLMSKLPHPLFIAHS